MQKVSEKELTIKRVIAHFWTGQDLAVPDADTFANIKEALRVYKDYGVISEFESCKLELVDRSGKEL